MRPSPAGSIVATIATAMLVSAVDPSVAAPTANELVQAASRPNAAAVALLLEAGAPIDGRDKSNATALQAAAARGHYAVAALLVERGADVNAPGKRALTALGWAARNGHDDIARLLVRSHARCERSGSTSTTPLSLAILNGRASTIGILLAPCASLFEQPLAATEIVENLAQSTDTGLARYLMPPMKRLLQSSAPFGEAAGRAVAIATPEVARAMLDSLGDAAASPRFATSLLANAAVRGRLDLIVLALVRGADLHAPDAKLGSPLAAAFAAEQPEAVDLLLALGANPHVSGVDAGVLSGVPGPALDPVDTTPTPGVQLAGDAAEDTPPARLMRAAARGDAATVRRLLRASVDPSASVERWPGDGGWTSLMVASAAGHTTIVAQLLTAGAPVDQKNRGGRTALSFAAWYARTSVVETLLAAGADPDAPDRFGHTPMMLAQAAGHEAEIELLRKHAGAAIPPRAAADPGPEPRAGVAATTTTAVATGMR